MAEALAMFYTGAVMLFISLGLTWLGLQRKAFLWHFLAAALFFILAVYGFTIPYEVNASGQVVGTSANILFSGFSLLGFFFNLFFTVKRAFELLA